MKHAKIPTLSYRLFKWFCKESIFEELEGDLEETFLKNTEQYGLRKARRIYTREVMKMIRPTVIKKMTTGPVYRAALLANYTTVAFRNLSNNKLFSGINIMGLAMSMTIGLLAIAFAGEMYRFDDFHEKGDRIYRIYNTRTSPNASDTYATTSLLTATRLKDFDGFEKIVPIRKGLYGDLSVGEKSFQTRGFFVGEDFLEVFTFPAIHGNAANALSEPYSAVVTESLALKVFSKTNVVGEIISKGDDKYLITAVLKDPPNTSHIKFEVLAAIKTLESKKKYDDAYGKWGVMWSSYVYVLLPENPDMGKIENNLITIEDEENAKVERFEIQLGMESMKSIFPGDGKYNQLDIVMPQENVTRIIILALIVLFSACFNYTNLSLARSLKRAKEVGIRKVVGASRAQLFSQFIIESVLISVISLGVGFFLFLLIKPEFLSLDVFTSNTTTLDLTTGTGFLFGGLAIAVGVLAGLIPSLIMTRFKPASILKGVSKMKVSRGIGVREIMTGLQFTFSMGFAILVILSYKQYNYATNFDLGFNTENVLNVPLQKNDPEVLKTAFSTIPAVQGISLSSNVPSTGSRNSDWAKRVGSPDSLTTYSLNIDADYLSNMEHELIAGTNFPSGKDLHMIVNEEFVKRFGFDSPQDALGGRISFYDKTRTIIGVVKDFHYGTIFNDLKPFAFLSGQQKPYYLNLKVASTDMVKTMDRLNAAWTAIDQKHEFKATFYEEQIANAYNQLSSTMKTFGLLAIVAISISILGLLGMAVYTTESRMKELTIRKVLGASVANMVTLLSKNFIRVFVIASAIAIPVSYQLFKNTVLENMKYTIDVGFWELASGSLFIIFIALMTISSQTFKAAKTNPATNLRNE